MEFKDYVKVLVPAALGLGAFLYLKRRRRSNRKERPAETHWFEYGYTDTRLEV